MDDKNDPGVLGIAGVIVLVVVVLGSLLFLAGPLLSSHGHHTASNETSAIASLVVCLSAQAIFHKTSYYDGEKLTYANAVDGNGYVDLYQIGYPDDRSGKMLKLIDKALADADGNAFDPVPKAGYFYRDILCADYSTEFALCAYPAEHDRTGRNTYIVNETGTVYMKDNGGRRVAAWPDDPAAEGWLTAHR